MAVLCSSRVRPGSEAELFMTCVAGYPTGGVAECGLLFWASLSAARSLSCRENLKKNL